MAAAAPVEAGHRATSATLVADIATRLKRPVVFDWDTERFVNDEQADRMLSRAYREAGHWAIPHGVG